jgi:hypothetical protein
MAVIPECDFAIRRGIALRDGLLFYRAPHPVPKITVSSLKIVDGDE